MSKLTAAADQELFVPAKSQQSIGRCQVAFELHECDLALHTEQVGHHQLNNG